MHSVKHLWPIVDEFFTRPTLNSPSRSSLSTEVSTSINDIPDSGSTQVDNDVTDIAIYVIHAKEVPKKSVPSIETYSSSTPATSLYNSEASIAVSSTVKTSLPSDSLVIVEYGCKFETWNWVVIRRVFLILYAMICVSLLVIIITLMVIYSRKCTTGVDNWWSGSILYKADALRFCDAAKGTGHFSCIRSKMLHFEKLHVKALILRNVMTSKKDVSGLQEIVDYFNYDERLGSEMEVKQFFANFPFKRLKLIIEVPMACTSIQHLWFKQSQRQNFVLGNKYTNYYIWKNNVSKSTEDWSYDSTRNQFYKFQGKSTCALLNWNNAEVRNAILNVIKKWSSIGIDGIYFKDLEHLHVEPYSVVLDLIKSWKSYIQLYNRSRKGVVMVSNKFVERFQNLTSSVGEMVDIIDTDIDIRKNENFIRKFEEEIPNMFFQKYAGTQGESFPVQCWNLQKYTIFPVYKLSSLMLMGSIPGSFCLQFGQEIGDFQLNVGTDGNLQWWNSGQDWVATSNEVPLQKDAVAFQRMVSEFLTLRSSNLVLSTAKTSDSRRGSVYEIIRIDRSNKVLSIRRTLPRRTSISIIVNLGSETVSGDFSGQLYRGRVLLDTGKKYTGWLDWNDLRLESGQCIVVEQKV